MSERRSGILFHITSLPSPFGIGDMGRGAYKFADFLATSKQGLWQILPLNPTDLVYGNSPYHSTFAFGGSSLLLSPELLAQEGFLDHGDLAPPSFPEERVDFPGVVKYKDALLRRAYERFKGNGEPDGYREFCVENAYWLDDFALFASLKEHHQGRVWSEWPHGLRDREPEALQSWKREHHDRVEREKFVQYLFFKQWLALKVYCNGKGIKIIGDIPIYVVYDSADVWAHPGLFNLDHEKRPLTVAGVPPDYFSETGQLWGNPVYRWDAVQATNYDWWLKRLAHNMKLFDLLRVDHFRGFIAYWEVPATQRIATPGQWVKAPAMDFFKRLMDRFPSLPIIAEDLGTITPDVLEVMDHFGFPGMKVLLFAFGEGLPSNPYAPHNHVRNCVVYTGTHDNNTTRGWFENEAAPRDKERLARYLGKDLNAETVHRDLIRLAMMSVADRVIIPMQDILGLGEEARMNLPAKKDGNWQWRLLEKNLTSALSRQLLEWTEIYGRG
ncbi:MAG: 4-alpha-glucanotransferase [Desulfobacterales bacterium]|nr:4-alpha-glucanotransferase [Desulfobacterales bacterium]